jgi:hypothetical protein
MVTRTVPFGSEVTAQAVDTSTVLASQVTAISLGQKQFLSQINARARGHNNPVPFAFQSAVNARANANNNPIGSAFQSSVVAVEPGQASFASEVTAQESRVITPLQSTVLAVFGDSSTVLESVTNAQILQISLPLASEVIVPKDGVSNPLVSTVSVLLSEFVSFASEVRPSEQAPMTSFLSTVNAIAALRTKTVASEVSAVDAGHIYNPTMNMIESANGTSVW